MQKLIEGARKFRAGEFGRYSELFHKLSRDGQNPHTLFITCSDSRVLAELITQSKPGDLFVVKNVGNIVPRADVTGSTNSTAAAIEFAVAELKVRDIVVCGHSQCGAMDALLQPRPASPILPHLEEWLRIADPVKKIVLNEYRHLTTDAERSTAAAEENVLFALENLHSYPVVQQRLVSGALFLHGWFFKIATAELFAYDPEANQFLPLVRTP